MKLTRLFLASLALALVTACSTTSLTEPDPSATDRTPQSVQRGTMGSGI